MSNDQRSPGEFSTRLVSFSAESSDQLEINGYDGFAEAYAASNDNNLANAYCERPAMLALAGDVAGRRILDAGCGSGALFAALRDRSAIVTGIDKSAAMVDLARRRLGADADLRVAELGSPLPFPDDAFDDVDGFSGAPLPGRLGAGPGRAAACAQARRAAHRYRSTIPLQRTSGTARPTSSLTISRPTTTSLNGPPTTRPRCSVSGPGRFMR